MREIKSAVGEYYHIFNRGNNKQDIFKTDVDRARLLFLVLYFQAPVPIFNLSRHVNHFVKHSVFNTGQDTEERIVLQRNVELVNFIFMPNHFHLTVFEKAENGISVYMQRMQNAYTKYFNTKNGLSGHLFQGPYRIVHITDNDQLLYLSTYIHRNSRELSKWKNKEHLYPWSSFQDYEKNRWGNLLATQIIAEQFASPEEYRRFVDESTAKKDFRLDENHLTI